MIILEPSPAIKKSTKIDFDLLGQILTMVVDSNHRKPINFIAKIQKSKQAGVSFCESKDDTGSNFRICIDQTSRQTRKSVFGSILHELRHCCQLNIFGYWPDTCKFKSYEEYFRSKEEVDARKIEALTNQVIEMYDAAQALYKKYRKVGLTKLG